MYGLIYSLKDPAGKGIAYWIRDYFGLEKCTEQISGAEECFEEKRFVLVGFSEDTIYFDFLDKRVGCVDGYIILSRHSSAKRVKSFTVHHTGNYGPEAPYGGKPGRLAPALSTASHRLLLGLKHYCEEKGKCKEYEVSYEATHHGPTEVSKPLCFIEIGSSLDEWSLASNHEVVGLAVVEFLEKGPLKTRVAIGIGGGHYPRKHTRLALEQKYTYGHIMAKYALPYLSFKTLDMMIEKTVPSPEIIVVEKKGTRREHRNLIEEYVDGKNLEIHYV